ncbi:MAG: hypothetical protein INQ03_10835 [Candidatus Heimdallarchaeota archaeon]|nr:hypothetical protein [Candidatus Heimdallarchaeota archaeon]
MSKIEQIISGMEKTLGRKKKKLVFLELATQLDYTDVNPAWASMKTLDRDLKRDSINEKRKIAQLALLTFSKGPKIQFFNEDDTGDFENTIDNYDVIIGFDLLEKFAVLSPYLSYKEFHDLKHKIIDLSKLVEDKTYERQSLKELIQLNFSEEVEPQEKECQLWKEGNIEGIKKILTQRLHAITALLYLGWEQEPITYNLKSYNEITGTSSRRIDFKSEI